MIDIIYIDDQRNKVDDVERAIDELRRLLDADIRFTFIGTLSRQGQRPLILDQDGNKLDADGEFIHQNFPAEKDVIDSFGKANAFYLLDVHFEDTIASYGAALAKFLVSNGVARERICLFTQFGEVVQEIEAYQSEGVPWFNYFDKAKFGLPEAYKRLAYELYGFIVPIAYPALEASFSDLGSVEGIVVGNSAEWRGVLKEAFRCAQFDQDPVLILGESGVGKDLVASLIHKLSPRGEKVFHEVNCGAIPFDQVGSSLFGVAGKAFTGVDKRRGAFEIANGGTLFLNELAKASRDVQASLLTVVEKKKIWPQGAEKSVDVDVRLISAMNIEPEEALREDLLLEDLFHRLNVVIIRIPSLKDRKVDIVPLASRFAHDYADKYKIGEKRFTDGAVKKLLDYDWPGNVRQLKAVVAVAFMRSEGVLIDSDDVLSAIRQCAMSAREPALRDLDDGRIEHIFDDVLAFSKNSRGQVRRNFREALALVIGAAAKGDLQALTILKSTIVGAISAVMSEQIMLDPAARRRIVDVLRLTSESDRGKTLLADKVQSDPRLAKWMESCDIVFEWGRSERRPRPKVEIVRDVIEKSLAGEVIG